MELANLKTELIKKINIAYKNHIYSQYSIEKQLNFSTGVNDKPQDKAAMIQFIKGKKSVVNNIEDLINALSDTNIFDNFPKDFVKMDLGGAANTDEWQKNFVESHLPGLDDEDKMMVAECLRNMK